MDDTTTAWAEPANPTPSEERVPFTARIPAGLLAELREYADSVDWSVNSGLISCIRGWLWTATRQLVEEPLADWEPADASGSGGRAYELTLTFRLPDSTTPIVALADAGFLPYEARDRAIVAIDALGARDVLSRLVALAPMSPDPRCPECDHGQNPAKLDDGDVLAPTPA